MEVIIRVSFYWFANRVDPARQFLQFKFVIQLKGVRFLVILIKYFTLLLDFFGQGIDILVDLLNIVYGHLFLEFKLIFCAVDFHLLLEMAL